MNFRMIGAIIFVILGTVALLFIINVNVETGSLKGGVFGARRSQAFLRCEQLVKNIRDESSWDKKWTLFQEEFKDCEKFPPTEPSETNYETSAFRDVVFNIGECFSNEKKNDKALEVYDRALKFDDWIQDDGFNSYSAHFLVRRARDLVLPSKNPQCLDLKGFQEQLQKFTAQGEAEALHALLYSDEVLDTQVMASDAGGYLSYQQWKDVYEDNKTLYKLKYLKKVGDSCFVTTGWDEDYPWRAFCAEKIGDQGCYYLTTIYAGIEATLDDFVHFKTSEKTE